MPRGSYKRYLDKESGEEDLSYTTLWRRRKKAHCESLVATPEAALRSFSNEPHDGNCAGDNTILPNFEENAPCETHFPSINEENHKDESQSPPIYDFYADETEFSVYESSSGNREEDSPQFPESSPGDTTDDALANLNLDDKVLEHCKYTKFEILLMILHFTQRFCLTDVAAVALIDLFNIVLGRKIIPPTSYYFKKIFKADVPTHVHLYCPKCMLYLGKKSDCKMKECPACTEPFASDQEMAKNYFITVPLKDQIKLKLEENGNAIINYRKQRIKNSDVIADVFDSSLFLDLEKNAKLTDNDITLGFSIDGAEVFKSGRQSMEPLQCFINELEPKARFSVENLLLCGLWFGRHKINMTAYLTPLVQELKTLASDGVHWYNKVTKTFVTSRIFLLNSVLDTIAKYPVMNMIAFNGKYGCYMCYHPGDSLPGARGQIRYGFRESVTERTNESLRVDMIKASDTGGCVKGVFGPSPFMYVPFFNVCTGFTVDYLHQCLLGATKYLFCTIWTKQTGEIYHLNDNELEKIDKVLLNLKAPSNISRDPRSVFQAADWKGNEWRNWLIYYGPVCLEATSLPRNHYNNFCLLSTTMNKLLQKEIKKSDLPGIGESLRAFACNHERLYGLSFMSYNIHMTTHIKRSVIESGPLWATAALHTERKNGFLVQLATGPKGVPLQVGRRWATILSIPSFISKHPPLQSEVSKFCQSLLPVQRLAKATSLGSITIIGNQVVYPPSIEDEHLFSEYGMIKDLFRINKIIYCHQIFQPHNGKAKKDDSIVKLKNGDFGKIESLWSFRTIPGKIFAVMKLINVSRSSHCQAGHIRCCGTYIYKNEKIIVSVSDTFDVKCLLMKRGNQGFITECYNNLDKD